MSDQNCVLLSWNVRGMNNPARRKVIKDLSGENSCTIVSLQETKMQSIDHDAVCETLESSFGGNFAILPADGTRGGALLAVHDEFYLITQTEVRAHSVSAKLQAKTGVVEWWLTVVYGPQDDQEKVQFLQELCDLRNSFSDK